MITRSRAAVFLAALGVVCLVVQADDGVASLFITGVICGLTALALDWRGFEAWVDRQPRGLDDLDFEHRPYRKH